MAVWEVIRGRVLAVHVLDLVQLLIHTAHKLAAQQWAIITSTNKLYY
jgi:hypothetical protein